MCPPCKIILDDGGVLPASANLLANTVGRSHPLYAPARYLADIVSASAAAIMEAHYSGALEPEQLDEAHAWSELNCHRASAIRTWVEIIVKGGHLPVVQITGGGFLSGAPVLMHWAEEDRLFTTRIIGGEYDGAWTIDGTKGVARKS